MGCVGVVCENWRVDASMNQSILGPVLGWGWLGSVFFFLFCVLPAHILLSPFVVVVGCVWVLFSVFCFRAYGGCLGMLGR